MPETMRAIVIADYGRGDRVGVSFLAKPPLLETDDVVAHIQMSALVPMSSLTGDRRNQYVHNVPSRGHGRRCCRCGHYS